MAGLERIDPRYTPIWERAREVLGADDRVLSVALGGSVGAATADRWSDLDLTVVAAAEHHEAFLADRPRWLEAITPTVLVRTPIAPFIINAVTADGLTLDFAVWSGQVIEFPPPKGYAVGMLSPARYDDVSAALEYAVLEQLRGLAGPFITFVQRGEHVQHLTGVPHLLGLLTTVFLAELDAPPLQGKHWNHTFTEEQLAAAAALPPVSATRDGIVGFGLGLAELMLTRARPLYPAHGLEWPTELAGVAATRLRDELGIDASAWLH